MTREIGFVNVKTISGYRKSNELFNWAKGASALWVDTFFEDNTYIHIFLLFQELFYYNMSSKLMFLCYIIK